MGKTFKDRKDIRRDRKEISKLKRKNKHKKSWKEDYYEPKRGC
jgi:hypothetical protein